MSQQWGGCAHLGCILKLFSKTELPVRKNKIFSRKSLYWKEKSILRLRPASSKYIPVIILADCECLIFAELLERSIKVFNTVSKAVEVSNKIRYLRENVWHKAGSLLLGAYRLTTVKILFKIVAWISLLL